MLIIFIERKTIGWAAKDERYRREKIENEKELIIGSYQFQSEVS
ncbi:MAG TPA: hypothetical protein VMW09_10300 [Desulfatiglandales bacterium]|nr:hypothetical protein [Desulfatiglandales bacterium]